MGLKRMRQLQMEEFHLSWEYLELTNQQQAFVDEFILTGGRKDQAAEKAFGHPAGSDYNRNAYCRALNQPAVDWALCKYYGVTRRDYFMKQLRRAFFHPALSENQVRVFELYAKCSGYLVSAEEEVRLQANKKRAKLRIEARVKRKLWEAEEKRKLKQKHKKEDQPYDFGDYEDIPEPPDGGSDGELRQ